MKSVWIALLIAGVTLLAPRVAAQSAPEPDTPSEPECPDIFALVKSEGFSDLKLGLLDTAVLSQLGQPVRRDRKVFWGADGLYHQKWHYARQGILLDMASSTPEGQQTVHSITITAPSPLRSRRGIGIGMTRAQVEQFYGAESRPSEAASNDWFIAGSAYGGLMFEFHNDRVIRMFLGAGAE